MWASVKIKEKERGAAVVPYFEVLFQSRLPLDNWRVHVAAQCLFAEHIAWVTVFSSVYSASFSFSSTSVVSTSN